MKKILIISALVLLIIAGLLAGCAEGKLSQQQLEQMVTDVLTANAAVETCKFDMDILTDIEIIGGSNAGKVPMTAKGTGIVDSVNKKMQMTLNMTIDIPDKGKQEIPAMYYFVDGWMYMKMSIPGQGDQWLRMKMPADMWDQKSQLNQQLKLLGTAENVEYMGTEDVNGTSCHVVQITPSSEALRDMISQVELPEMGGIDLTSIDLADLLKVITVKEWIASDTNLFVKTEQHMVIEINAEDFGAAKDDFQKIVEDINVNMRLYDYNKSVTIELPVEALEATSLQ